MQVPIRNMAIIAHVDHGKTTLIDGLFKQAGTFEAHKAVEERIMDSGDIEKERGITITAKNASFVWKDVKVNIVDTPGHADFGGEVERALFMVDGALLLVDASEGPLPQTRFVLRKALEQGIKIVVVINKVDRPDARIPEIEEKIHDLFLELATHEDQLNFKTLYASARQGWASLEKDVVKKDFKDLLDTIIDELPAPKVDVNQPFKLLVANLTYNNYVGQMVVGRIESGKVKVNQPVFLLSKDGKKRFSVVSIETFFGIGTEKVETLSAGNIALIAGIQDAKIGDTVAESDSLTALPRIEVDPPTVSVRISVNTSPFAGKDGEYLTSRKLEEVLKTECLKNVAINFEPGETPEVFVLKARGELQIVVLLETLRRRGYELMVGRPEIIPQMIDGQQKEPQEMLVIDIPEGFVGTITELVSSRGGRMESMEPMGDSGRTRLQFAIPSRGLIGLRSDLLTASRGEAIFSSSIIGYVPYLGKRFSRKNGAIVSDRTGMSTQYALFHLQPRGILFIKEGEDIYEGMVVGENNKANDMNANAAREKKLTNIRAAGKDESTKLDPITSMSLDRALEWIDEDEWVEITPSKLRIRKSELRTTFRKVIRGVSDE